MMNLKIVYPLSVSRVNQDGSPYEFTETRFFDQTKLFVDYQKIDSAYIAKDDDNYYLIPDEASVEINPEMHGFGNPDINEAYKRTENVSDYTKAYAAFGKDRTLDYSAQIDKDLLDTNTENILGVSLVKVDENYQPQQVMPSAIGTGEQRVPTNNALLKETLYLIRSHIANKSNAHAIEAISELSNSLNQLTESIVAVNVTANESLEIAENAATTAGEAAQAINEHAQATTNPHPANTTQSFAEVVITPLKSDANGGSVADADYNWFKGVYASLVDGSVLSWIKGLVNQVKSLATRVGLLEDKYILKYVVPVNKTEINLSTDRYGNNFNFSEGDEIEITFTIPAWVNISTDLARINLRLNNLSSSIYYVQNIVALPEAATAGTNYKTQRTRIVFTINNKEIIGLITNQSMTSGGSRVSELYPFYTSGLNSTTISSIQLILSTPNARIPLGTVILIKKI